MPWWTRNGAAEIAGRGAGLGADRPRLCTVPMPAGWPCGPRCARRRTTPLALPSPGLVLASFRSMAEHSATPCRCRARIWRVNLRPVQAGRACGAIAGLMRRILAWRVQGRSPGGGREGAEPPGLRVLACSSRLRGADRVAGVRCEPRTRLACLRGRGVPRPGPAGAPRRRLCRSVGRGRSEAPAGLGAARGLARRARCEDRGWPCARRPAGLGPRPGALAPGLSGAGLAGRGGHGLARAADAPNPGRGGGVARSAEAVALGRPPERVSATKTWSWRLMHAA